MKNRQAFTLVELLVVIAVIALLMAILMPVLRRAQDQATRIVCGNRQKNLLLSFMMYADTYNNKIPNGGGYWPWDVPMTTRNILLKDMGYDIDSFSNDITPQNPNNITLTSLPPPLPSGYGGGSSGVPIQYSDNFYCPANKYALRYRSLYWNYSSYIVAGFGFLWYAPWNDQGKLTVYAAMAPEDIPSLTDSAKKWVDRVDMPQSSEHELLVDITMCSFSRDRAKYPYGNFLKIAEGGYDEGTSHFVTDAKALGGNIGFVDGHVEWRQWTNMKIRLKCGPYWWW